jgi:hypothetical protein
MSGLDKAFFSSTGIYRDVYPDHGKLFFSLYSYKAEIQDK